MSCMCGCVVGMASPLPTGPVAAGSYLCKRENCCTTPPLATPSIFQVGGPVTELPTEVLAKSIMGTPFDVAAGAAGFASLGILLLQGCIKGFTLLSTAQNFGKDADVARCEIEFQQYRLFRWAEQAGLNEKSPNRSLNWAVINEQLKQLESLVNCTSKFKGEYGLELVETDENMSAEDLEPPKTGLRRLVAQVKPDFHNETARMLQKGASVWKRLKWAMVDKMGLSMLINDIRGFVDNLNFLLQETDNKFIQDGIEALLRHVISQATEVSELSKIEQLLDRKSEHRTKVEESAVATALRMKQKRFMLGFGEEGRSSVARSSQVAETTRTTLEGTLLTSSSVTLVTKRPAGIRAAKTRKPLSHTLLDGASSSHRKFREMATYDGKLVLVEWKTVEQGVESKLKHRIKNLAALLEDVDSPSFHSLNCLGYLKDPVTGNYGYVFRPPHEESKEFISLSEVLNVGPMFPSLGDRIALATALVETILQLHTSGWLHKGIRSDNILFFHQPPMTIRVTQPYLEGYEYARADNPSDMTESPTLQQEADLFRHPALLKANRASFCKSYDLYALGCVLVEIGLWQSLATVLLHRNRMKALAKGSLVGRFPTAALSYLGKAEAVLVSKAKSILLVEDGPGSIMEALKFFAGTQFADVVMLCLSAPDQRSGSSEPEESDDDEDHCIDLELDILEKLRGLRL